MTEDTCGGCRKEPYNSEKPVFPPPVAQLSAQDSNPHHNPDPRGRLGSP